MIKKLIIVISKCIIFILDIRNVLRRIFYRMLQ